MVRRKVAKSGVERLGYQSLSQPQKQHVGRKTGLPGLPYALSTSTGRRQLSGMRQPTVHTPTQRRKRSQVTSESAAHNRGALTYGSRRSIFLAARGGTGASPLGDDNGPSGNATLPAAFFGTAAAPAAPGAGTGRCDRAVSVHTWMTTCPRGCHRRTCSSDVNRLRRNSRASRSS